MLHSTSVSTWMRILIWEEREDRGCESNYPGGGKKKLKSGSLCGASEKQHFTHATAL